MKRVQLVDSEDENDFLLDYDYIKPSSAYSSSTLPPNYALPEDLEPPTHLPAAATPSPYFISRQPPREVRTSKKKDKRIFSCQLSLLAPHVVSHESFSVITCRILFADDLSLVPGEDSFTAQCFQNSVEFADLQISLSSLKANDREFCLAFYASNNVFRPFLCTQRFYSFSNVGVLRRRKEVEIVALGNGEDRLHVIGKTFFNSSRLTVVFRFMDKHQQHWRSVPAKNLVFFSESVLFFDDLLLGGEEIGSDVFVQVSNNGLDFSNALKKTSVSPARQALFAGNAVGVNRSSLTMPFELEDFEEFQARL